MSVLWKALNIIIIEPIMVFQILTCNDVLEKMKPSNKRQTRTFFKI